MISFIIRSEAALCFAVGGSTYEYLFQPLAISALCTLLFIPAINPPIAARNSATTAMDTFVSLSSSAVISRSDCFSTRTGRINTVSVSRKSMVINI